MSHLHRVHHTNNINTNTGGGNVDHSQLYPQIGGGSFSYSDSFPSQNPNGDFYQQQAPMSNFSTTKPTAPGGQLFDDLGQLSNLGNLAGNIGNMGMDPIIQLGVNHFLTTGGQTIENNVIFFLSSFFIYFYFLAVLTQNMQS